MKNDYLDVRSPYLKHNVYSLDNRERNTLSLREEATDFRESSDTFLTKKVENVSRRIVGGEIRKFAEVASREISTEFSNLEERLKAEAQNNLENNFKELGENLALEVDSKIQELNYLINGTEEKLSQLNFFSKNLEQEVKHLASKIRTLNSDSTQVNPNSFKRQASLTQEEETLEKASEPVFKINLTKQPPVEKVRPLEVKEINYAFNQAPRIFRTSENITLYLENEKTHQLLKKTPTTLATEDSQNKERGINNSIELNKNDLEEKEYLNQKLAEVTKLFEKNSFLFKKNTFVLSLKDLLVTDILENTLLNAKQLDQIDLLKLKNILDKLTLTLNLYPEENEKVIDFLKRSYREEYLRAN